MENKITVTSDNIFPIIKRFLYSNNEIFLRELVSNSVDAILKFKTLSNLGKINTKYDDNENIIKIKLDKNNKKIHIIDYGIGMTKNEIYKYINQIAFSGAEEFVEKYKNVLNINNIIGHFGLGFYSSFMVSDKVEIITKSYVKNSKTVHWECEGTPDFKINIIDDNVFTKHGTEVILHINNDNEEFLNEFRIKNLLFKYCKFMPIPIKFININDNDVAHAGKFINNTKPLWISNPTDIQDLDYVKFFKELYPLQINDPIFWIHIKIDYPFKLNGILFLPKTTNKIDLQKSKIHLYQNQVYVTDNLEGVVPDFLMLLCGVIDSPDIPLNVSRSYLQTDKLVKKISNYITRKVADKFQNIFSNNRSEFIKKWNDIKIIIEYGILTDNNFFDKTKNLFLINTINNEYFTINEYKDKIKINQTDKNNKIIFLYTCNEEKDDLYIKSALNLGYNILKFNSPLTSHLLQKLEHEYHDILFIRVDAGNINNLIQKNNIQKNISILSDEQKNILKKFFEEEIDKNKFNVRLTNEMSNYDIPIIISMSESLRRMIDINKYSSDTHGANKNYAESEKYDFIINANNKLMYNVVNILDKNKRKSIIKNIIDLALISQNLLTGRDLSKFIIRSFKKLK